jgi:hypothetical protein
VLRSLPAALLQVFKIDDHMGIAISGLTADGRILCRYMRNECLNHRYVYESPMPLGRLVRQVADKAQVGLGEKRGGEGEGACQQGLWRASEWGRSSGWPAHSRHPAIG